MSEATVTSAFNDTHYCSAPIELTRPLARPLHVALLEAGELFETAGQVNAQVLVFLAQFRELANETVPLVAERVDLALDFAEAGLGHADGIDVVAHSGARRCRCEEESYGARPIMRLPNWDREAGAG